MSQQASRRGAPHAGAWEVWRGAAAVGTVAACGFSGVLYKLIQSPEVLGMLRDVISKGFSLL